MAGNTDARAARAKVLFLIGSLAIGGAETQLVRLANGLDRTRYEPSIACFWEGDELADKVAPDVLVFRSAIAREARRSNPDRVIMVGRILSSTVRTIRRVQPDIVHAYLPAAYVLGGFAAWTLRVPVIIAGRRGLTSYETLGPGRFLGRAANRVIDVQICNSEAVRQWAISMEGLSQERTRVVNNGIDLPELDVRPQIPPEWRSTGATAGMIANLIRYKGHAEVLRAVAQVAKRYPSFRIVLIGEGVERSSLTELVTRLGITCNVVFAGRRRDAAELVQGFDFTILGSSEEGFPNALMESMARAVPVISTSVGGVPDLVTDGVQGRLVAYGDPNAMADAIIWMIEHPAERGQMGAAGRELIARRYSTQRMVSETEVIYEELLRKVRDDHPTG